MLARKKTIGTIGYMGGIMSLPEPFVYSWTQMLEFNQDAMCQENEQIKYMRSRYSLHSAARNELVENMRGDWLLQLDTDLIFDPDFCARLVATMERYDLDILTGLYTYKSNPGVPTIYMYNEALKRHEPIIGGWDDSTDLLPIDSAGGGCLLVRRRVFERIISETRQPPFEMIPPMGEDHSFFMRARQLGIKAYCAWKIQAAHLGFKEVQHEFADFPQQYLTEYPVTGFGTRKGALQA